MSIREYLQRRLVRRGTKRIMRYFTIIIEEVDYLEKESRPLGDEEMRDLLKKLPQISAIMEWTKFELVTATHPLRHLAVNEEETRNRLIAATGIKCPKCSR